MNKKGFLLFSLSMIALPILTFSCSAKNHIDSKNKYIFYEYKNQANTTSDFNFHATSVDKYIDNDVESLTSSFLFRYKYSESLEFDYVNSRVLKPSKKWLIMNLASSIVLTMEDNSTLTYDNDEHEIIPSANLGNGYDSKVILLTSENPSSINSKDFKNNLNKAKKIEVFLKEKNYLNNENKLSSYSLKAMDFYYSLMRDKLSDLSIRKDMNISLKNNEINRKWNLKNKLSLYKINDEDLFDKNNYDNQKNSITFNKKNQWDFAGFFENELIQNLVFSPVSSDFINDTFDALNYGLQSYGKTLNDSLFLSDYVFISNTIEKQIFDINSDLDLVDYLNKPLRVEINYTISPLNQKAYEIQSFNRFKNSLLSTLDVDSLNLSDANDVIKNQRYKISYNSLRNSNNNINKIFWKIIPESTSNNFNENFKKLIYGDLNLNYFYNDLSFEFRNNLSNLINYFALNFISKNKTYWHSYANDNMLIFGKNNQTNNYNKLYDAYYHLNSFTSFLKKESINENIIDQREKFYLFKDDQNNILKSKNFEKIKKNLNHLLDNFINQNNIKGNFEWQIPVYEKAINQEKYFAYNQVIQLIKSIHPSLKPELKLVSDIHSLNELKSNSNSYTKYIDINYSKNNLSEFFANLIFNDEVSLLYPIIFFDSKKWQNQQNLNLFTRFENFQKFFKNSIKKYFDFDLDFLKTESKLNKIFSKFKSKISNFSNDEINKKIYEIIENYQRENINFDLIKLVNEIDLIYTKPIDLNSFTSMEFLNLKIVQDRFDLPYREDGIINYFDIFIK
ncbi:OppA family ABC transporter substrate-binding lipoprotein [Mycoplasmopsis pulmonis]|uniref:OppA family ABC transporter substrate-binding lipoprotein n=1 Tax=Mycoplasmopsis pulmonis TaxID=2107 RepID=UPI0010051759|nr:hypothetical protein [Mycoplasmopsis pulmonis]VEU68368.1 Uncharacterised protein [Mycoplasmopsis pulmonis]